MEAAGTGVAGTGVAETGVAATCLAIGEMGATRGMATRLTGVPGPEQRSQEGSFAMPPSANLRAGGMTAK